MRGLRIFGRFWWDFLIGEAPEFFFATIGIVILALFLRHHSQAAYLALPIVSVLALVASTFRVAKRSGGD